MTNMALTKYQHDAMKTAQYPMYRDNLLYPALKLAGEAGEVAEKVGKLMRDRGYMPGVDFEITMEERENLIKEIGDVLWYVAAMADELQYDLQYVAEVNLDKLQGRLFRGTLRGSGDDR